MKRLALVGLFSLTAVSAAIGQELEPGAYRSSPIGFNIVALGYGYKSGDVSFDPAAPIEQAIASIHTLGAGFVRTLGLLGRMASVGILVPGVAGHLEGLYIGEFAEVDRLGFADPRLRLAVNLVGAPAMTLREFATYRQTTNLGVSLVAIPPLGQYNPERLINLGSNRWSFKPELGISHAAGRWTFEVYLGIWFFSNNTDFFGGRTRTQKPIASTQFHALYTIKPRMWIAVNANFYRGGRTTVDGNANLDLQENSRVGATIAIPIAPLETIKVSYSRGAFTTIGAKFDAIAVAYQYVWGG